MEKSIVIIEDWLNDCNDIEDSKNLSRFVDRENERLIYAIFTLLEERTRYAEVFEGTVKLLFIFSKNSDEKLREFVLFFAPSLIYIYLSAISVGDKRSIGSVEYTLLALYNKEVLDDLGQPRVSSFRLPTLARQSIYHEPGSLAPASFTTESLHRLEAGDAETVRWGPPKHMDTVTAASRYHLVTALLVAFNTKLTQLPKIVLMHLCKISSKLVCQGFNRPGHHHRASYGSDGSFGLYPRPVPRIPITSDLLTEITHSVYFAMFNDFASLGMQALDDIHMRAQYELFPDVLLMTNGIKNSLKVNPSGQPSDGPMGISIALTPSTATTPLSKSCITNASFRTKKLPDDIPIQRTVDSSNDSANKCLKSISEEIDLDDRDSNRPIRTPQGSGREKLKLSSNLPLPNLVKKREKDRLKNGEKRDSDKRVERRSKDKEKESRESINSNRNSAVLFSAESEGTPANSALVDSLKPNLQQSIEMKTISKGSPIGDGSFKETVKIGVPDPRIEDAFETLAVQIKPQSEVNGGENHIRKVV